MRTLRASLLRSEPWLEAAEAHRVPVLSEAERGEMSMCFAPDLSHLENVCLIPQDWLLLAEHGLLIESLDPTMAFRPHKAHHVKEFADGVATLELPEREVRVAEPCVLLGSNPSHYHWLLYHLPRLMALERFPALAGLRLIVGESLPPQHLESLRHLGIEESRLLRLSNDALYRCSALWVPAALTDRMHVHPAALRWLRRTFAGSENPRQRGRRVLTSRRDAPLRQLVNEEEVAAALAPLGFELQRCGALGFAEQVRLFSEAEVVVGGTGSALSNAVFAPGGALIVELHNYRGARFLDFLCMQLGQYYERLVGELRPRGPDTKLHYSDFLVRPELLLERLAALGVR